VDQAGQLQEQAQPVLVAGQQRRVGGVGAVAYALAGLVEVGGALTARLLGEARGLQAEAADADAAAMDAAAAAADRPAPGAFDRGSASAMPGMASTSAESRYARTARSRVLPQAGVQRADMPASPPTARSARARHR